MADESSATSHLSIAMVTEEIDKTQTTGVTSMMSSAFVGYGSDFYIRLGVVVIGAVGTAGNGLVLYALFASKQHKKHMLIVNQNILDLFASFFLSVTYGVQLFNIPLSGQLGHWLCVMLLSALFIFVGFKGSVINLAFVTIDRYLMIVRPAFSKRWLRPRVIYLACALSWFVAILWDTPVVFHATKVIDGMCVSYAEDDVVGSIVKVIAFVVTSPVTISLFLTSIDLDPIFDKDRDLDRFRFSYRARRSVGHAKYFRRAGQHPISYIHCQTLGCIRARWGRSSASYRVVATRD